MNNTYMTKATITNLIIETRAKSVVEAKAKAIELIIETFGDLDFYSDIKLETWHENDFIEAFNARPVLTQENDQEEEI